MTELIITQSGHTDNVKCIVVNTEGTQCLSASSDGTIRLWSLGQQRCVSTLRIHDEGVWTLQANDSFNTVLSSGRDRRVWMTDLRNQEQRTLLCETTAPVLRLCLTPDMEHVWVATTESSIKRYVSYLWLLWIRDRWTGLIAQFRQQVVQSFDNMISWSRFSCESFHFPEIAFFIRWFILATTLPLTHKKSILLVNWSQEVNG